MKLNDDSELTGALCFNAEDALCGELEKLFNNVMSTVVDYFEEAVTE